MLRLTQHLCFFTQAKTRFGEELTAHARQFLQRVATFELLGFLALGPLVVARRVDNWFIELLKLEIDFLVIAGIGLGNRWQDVSASAGHAAGVGIAHVN